MGSTATASQRRPGDAVTRWYDCSLPHHAAAAPVARHAARPVLISWGLDEETAYDALLVISELVTNAVEHALPPVVLHLAATPAADGHTSVVIDVTDGGPAPEDGSWTASCEEDEHGRGQQVVSALADHTGIAHHEGTDRHDRTDDHWASIQAP